MIDRALNNPIEAHLHAIVALVTSYNLYRLAERVRRRATFLMRAEKGDCRKLLAVRDALIMALYAANAPAGWANAFCDGSSLSRNNERHAGIGVIVLSESGQRITQLFSYIGNKSAFEAEAQAVSVVLRAAVKLHLSRIRVHTDNKALVRLWREHRRDTRLDAIRAHVAQVEKLQLCAIPRLHNQAANNLAKQAALSRK